MKPGRRRWYVAAAIVALTALAFWQWPRLARLIITETAASVAHVRLSFGGMTLTTDRAVFQDVRVTSFGGEPIATAAHLAVTYDVRDLLPGGKRLYGLKSIAADTPHLVIVRHADGTYNVPILKLSAKPSAKQRPLILRASIRDGSIEIVNESANALPNQRHLYVDAIQAVAELSRMRTWQRSSERRLWRTSISAAGFRRLNQTQAASCRAFPNDWRFFARAIALRPTRVRSLAASVPRAPA